MEGRRRPAFAGGKSLARRRQLMAMPVDRAVRHSRRSVRQLESPAELGGRL